MLDIVAEIGASHGQDMDKAKALVDGAILAGADYIKLQTYTPDTISFKGSGTCPSGPWKGRDLYDIYKAAHMPRKMQYNLIRWMEARGVDWFSTPFSPDDVNMLESMHCPLYKISSFDVHNEPLIEAVRATGSPVIWSDGMDRKNVPYTNDDIVLRCVSQYPADPEQYGLSYPPPCPNWGISDHTDGAILGSVAISMGAMMIEKHIKLDDDTSTEDSQFATPLSQFSMDVALWRRVQAIAHSSENPVSELSGIIPRPVEMGGKTLWKRYV